MAKVSYDLFVMSFVKFVNKEEEEKVEMVVVVVVGGIVEIVVVEAGEEKEEKEEKEEEEKEEQDNENGNDVDGEASILKLFDMKIKINQRIIISKRQNKHITQIDGQINSRREKKTYIFKTK